MDQNTANLETRRILRGCRRLAGESSNFKQKRGLETIPEEIEQHQQDDTCQSLKTNSEDLVSITRFNKNKTQIVIGHVKGDLHSKADFIEDSNSCSSDTAATLMNRESGDQRVPEVKPLAGVKDILEQKLSTTLSSNTKPIGFRPKLVRSTALDFTNELIDIESPIKTTPTDNQEKETFNFREKATERKLTTTKELKLSKNINKSCHYMHTSTPVDNQSKLSTNEKSCVPEKSDNYDTDIQPKLVKKGKKAHLLGSDASSDESDVTNKLVIEEAEEAPDDNESVDSMDEEERQYLGEKRKLIASRETYQARPGTSKIETINVRKRKQRPEEDNRKNKVFFGFLDKVPVPRPTTVLDQFDKKATTAVVSTTKFSVDNTNNSQSPEQKKRKILQKPKVHILQKPKVLPRVLTACTSGSGFTTKFQISTVPNVPKVIRFVAQPKPSTTSNNNMKNKKQTASKYKTQKKIL